MFEEGKDKDKVAALPNEGRRSQRGSMRFATAVAKTRLKVRTQNNGISTT